MLWFLGIGISGTDSIPARVLQVIEKADLVYLERFTSPVDSKTIERISEISGGRMKIARRWMVEDGREILDAAAESEVALVSYGDPYVATTHLELRTRAAQRGIQTGTVHAASALTAAVGESGLHHYKMGRVATVMGERSSAATPYWIIYGNLARGGHTALLLEYDQEKETFLDPSDALGLLLEIEDGQRRGVISESSYVIVASRVGSGDQRILAGTIRDVRGRDFGRPPHALIIPGALHFTESDALRVLATCLDEPRDNTVRKISRQMIEKYVPMVRKAARDLESLCGDLQGARDILDNADLYASDAERFLEEEQEELAVLCIGYADGLVDALRISKGLDPGTGGPSEDDGQ